MCTEGEDSVSGREETLTSEPPPEWRNREPDVVRAEGTLSSFLHEGV